jgi:hypothetical protein
MQLRRIILTLALSTTVALTTACGSDSDKTPQGATPTGSTTTSAGAPGGASGAPTSGAAGTPAGDVKANTEAVCKGVVAAYDKEKEALTAALGELLMASAKEDKAAEAAAKAKGQVVLDRLSKAINAELVKAQDPGAKAALETFVATFAKVLQGNNLSDDAFSAEMDKATAAASKYCPALAE